MIPVPPSSPENLRTFFLLITRALAELQVPTKPALAFRCASTALPPPGDYVGAIIDLTDLNTIAKSDGTNWRRVDTGATL